MSKKKYRLLPLLVAMVFLMSNVIVVNASYDGTKYPLASGDYANVYNVCVCAVREDCDFDTYIYYTISSDSEVVIYKHNANGIDRYHFVSKGPFLLEKYACDVSRVDGSMIYESSGSSLITVGQYANWDTSYDGQEWSSGYNEVIYNSLYVFEDVDSSIAYLESGSMDGLLINKSSTYDSENIYLNNFRVIYHDSNIFEECYVEVKYDLPQYMVDNAQDSVLQIAVDYNCDVDFISGLFDVDTALDFSYVYDIDLSLFPYGVDIYISDICPDDDMSKGRKNTMLGDEAIIDFSTLGMDGVARVIDSTLYFGFVPMMGSSCGMQYDAQIDLLNPSNTTYYSSTPDSKGNYTTNNDYTQSDGYFTTIVGEDGQGNPTYNYYYYDNSKHYSVELGADFDTDTDIDTDIGIGGGISSGSDVLTIIWGNALEIDGSLGGSGGSSSSTGGDGGDVIINGSSGSGVDVTIEDDDYTDNALRDDLADGFGLLDNNDTDELDDGYLAVASAFFESIDPDAAQILMFGISSVVAIGILKAVFRR